METTIPKFTMLDFYAVENERSRSDVSYFIEEYVKIEDRDVEGIVIPFRLWESQKNPLLLFLTERLVQILKANQLGLTWLILAYATWRLINKVGFSVKGISETEIKAKELIRRVGFILKHLPDWMMAKQENPDVRWYEETALAITIHHPRKNGISQEDSTIQAFASSPTAGASFTANLFLFDEWALQEYAREIWTYAFPTINRSTGGQVIGISTIERGTLFEEIWSGENDFVKVFLGWFSDPKRDQKWYDKTVRAIGLDETRKHYPATAAEALSIPGGGYFNKFRTPIHIKARQEVPQWYNRYRVMDYGMDMLACYWIYIDNQNYARIYREFCKSGLVISQAAYEILRFSGAQVPETVQEWDVFTPEQKNKISLTQKEKIQLTYAPPDLFSRSSQTGKPSSEIWSDNGISLTKTKNDFEQGCISMNQWLNPITIKDEQTGLEYQTAYLTIDEDTSPNLVNSLLNIQKDKNHPEVYAKQPHALTHPVDSIRYFCTERAWSPNEPIAEKVYTNHDDFVHDKVFVKIQKKSMNIRTKAEAL